VQRVPQSRVWRVALVVTPRAKKPVVDLRGYLTLYGEVLTETMVYQWSP
jgi:glucan biosynthesis protein